MSKLLLNEHPLLVLPSLAKALDSSDRAIILQQIHYWISDPRAPLYNFRRWHYATYAEWLEQFPWLSKVTLGRHMRWLQEQKLILCEQPKTHEGDRTKWYTINYDQLELLERGGSVTETPPHDIKMIPSPYQNDTTHGIKMIPSLKEKRLREETKKENNNPLPLLHNTEQVDTAKAFVAVLKEGEKKKACNGTFTYEYYDDELTQALGRWDISNARSNALIVKHGRERMKEVIEMTVKRQPDKPAAYMHSLLIKQVPFSEMKSGKVDDYALRSKERATEEQKRRLDAEAGAKLLEANRANPERLERNIGALWAALKQKNKQPTTGEQHNVEI